MKVKRNFAHIFCTRGPPQRLDYKGILPFSWERNQDAKCEMCLRPHRATYISTTKLDIPDLVSFFDTTQPVLKLWQVSFAYLFLFWNDRTMNLRDRPISRVMLAMRNSLSPKVDTINHYNSLILADRRLKMRLLVGDRVWKVEICSQNQNWN